MNNNVTRQASTRDQVADLDRHLIGFGSLDSLATTLAGIDRHDCASLVFRHPASHSVRPAAAQLTVCLYTPRQAAHSDQVVRKRVARILRLQEQVFWECWTCMGTLHLGVIMLLVSQKCHIIGDERCHYLTILTSCSGQGCTAGCRLRRQHPPVATSLKIHRHDTYVPVIICTCSCHVS